MKANYETLKQALELTCKAHHNTEIRCYQDEMQFGIMDAHLPIMTDVQTICKAFFGDNLREVFEPDLSWGMITIYADIPFLPEVDTKMLDMALPYGWIEQIKD